MVAALFLVFGHQAIELVAQGVDRGIHVGIGRIGVDVAAAYVQGGLGLLGEFLHGQDT